MGEEVDATKAGGVGEEAFTEEYVTGDVGLKEYDYSYRDYNEPILETAEVEANMGPALSAVTDEGGVSRFAVEAKKRQQNQFQPTLNPCLCQIVFNVLSNDLFEFAISQISLWIDIIYFCVFCVLQVWDLLTFLRMGANLNTSGAVESFT